MKTTLDVRVSLKIHGQIVGLDGFQAHCESEFSPINKNDFPMMISGNFVNYRNHESSFSIGNDSMELFFNSRRYRLVSISREGAFELHRDW